VIRPEHLELTARGEPPDGLGTLETAEREHITRVLKATGGHKSKAADVLGVSRPRLDRLIEKYGLADLARTRRSANETDTNLDES